MTKIIDIDIKEKVYKSKNSNLSLLNDFRLEVNTGEKIAIVGKSGAGKTTLLNILGLLDRNYVGSYSLFGLNTNEMNLKMFAKLRNQRIGFVLQESALINSLTIEENIKLPFLYAKYKEKSDVNDFDTVIDDIGIKSIIKKKPLECSGGEKSRAVFARAIMMKPQVILCDEPTASLDGENKERIIALLSKMNSENNTTIITVTHDLEVANTHDRIIRLERRM
ncbi:MAG: ABC transporter ATP-binding protein [Pseudobutyrivibrio sp.]|nr:ABC transporter ATP-binding protein [Pseudobutyrivibrio sp.]